MGEDPRHGLLVALVVALVGLLVLIFAALTVAPVLVIVLGLMTYVVWWYVSREDTSYMHHAQVCASLVSYPLLWYGMVRYDMICVHLLVLVGVFPLAGALNCSSIYLVFWISTGKRLCLLNPRRVCSVDDCAEAEHNNNNHNDNAFSYLSAAIFFAAFVVPFLGGALSSSLKGTGCCCALP